MALINKLNAIGDAIRAKTGKTDLLTLDQMPTEIAAISGEAPVLKSLSIAANGVYVPGEGVDGFNHIEVNVINTEEIPETAFTFTGDCGYMFANEKWNWFLDSFQGQITTKNITDAGHMFDGNISLTGVPFDINLKNTTPVPCSYLFAYCQNLLSAPAIKGSFDSSSKRIDLDNLFFMCNKLREIPDDYFYNIGDTEFWEGNKQISSRRNNMFGYCFSLRSLPDITMLATESSLIDYSFYNNGFNYCIALDEIRNLPVSLAIYTENAFVKTFDNCSRLKALTFKTNADGSAIVAYWKNQVIDLTVNFGCGNSSMITGYNSGITKDKEITTEGQYEALKDDPDAYAIDYTFSRYNYNSAIETINSLPDTSSYITATDSTNIIKFNRVAGTNTDGGAIENLTEAEIAIAAAKGWTVAYN